MLRSGSTGPHVRDLQQVLNVTVPLQPLLKVDGIFGPMTKARVIAFQKQARLAPDGIVGPVTSKALVGAVLSDLGAGTDLRRE